MREKEKRTPSRRPGARLREEETCAAYEDASLVLPPPDMLRTIFPVSPALTKEIASHRKKIRDIICGTNPKEKRLLANAIPSLIMIKDMDRRGKLLNGAFMTCAAYMLGDHLAFCGATAPKLLVPLLVTKFAAGAAAFLLALFYLKFEEKRA